MNKTKTATRSCRTRKRAFLFYSPGVVRRSHAAERKALLLVPVLCRRGANVKNIVFNLYAKFTDDQF